MPPKKSQIPPVTVFDEFAERAIEQAREQVAEVAEEGKELLVDGIKRQRFPSFKEHPLTPEYAAEKKRKGLDPRVMIRTGHYVENIVHEKIDEDTHVVTLAEGARTVDDDGKETDTPLERVARAHEYGTDTLPARTHWRPTVRELRRRHRRELS